MKLKIKLLIFSLPFILCLFSGCAGSQQGIDTSRIYSPNELNDDLDFLLQTYEQVHPDLYVITSKNVIDSLHKQVQTEFNSPRTSFEFYKFAAPIVTKLGDGHTNLSFPGEFRKKYLDGGGKIIPFDVRIDGDRLFIQQNYSGDSVLSPNSEIVSINNIPTKEILINLRKYKPGENINNVNDHVQYMFKPLIWTCYGFDGNFNIEYLSALNSQHYIKSYPGITSAYLDSVTQINNNSRQPYLKWKLQTIVNENTAIIKMNSFGNEDDLEEFNRFLDSAFIIIQHENINNLVIDVRGNGGGDNIIGEALIDYLATKPWALSSKGIMKFSRQVKEEYIPWWLRWVPLKTLIYTFSFMFTSFDIDDIEIEPDSAGNRVITIIPELKEPVKNPLRYSGNTYVLIDHGSYSMSVMFAAVMKDYNFATLIGEETGQEASPYGMVQYFQLPNTNLRASVPSGRSFRPNGKIDGKGVIPDFEVKQTPGDTEKKTDTVLEFTKKLIREKKSIVNTAR